MIVCSGPSATDAFASTDLSGRLKVTIQVTASFVIAASGCMETAVSFCGSSIPTDPARDAWAIRNASYRSNDGVALEPRCFSQRASQRLAFIEPSTEAARPVGGRHYALPVRCPDRQAAGQTKRSWVFARCLLVCPGTACQHPARASSKPR
jgi:hypothetical protein